VISGNVSFYNESFGQAIYPTPVVGMLGLLPDATVHCTSGFKQGGDVVLLLGSGSPALDGSEYQKRWYGRVEGRVPDVDLAAEAALQRLLTDAITDGLLRSAHDCADGGLAVALAESCLAGGLGARVDLDAVTGTAQASARHDVALFGEVPGRVVVSIGATDVSALLRRCDSGGVSCALLGTVKGDALQLQLGAEHVEVALVALRDAFEGGLPAALAGR